MKLNQKNLGLICVGIASLMWALEPVVAKLAFGDSDFLETSAARALLTFILAYFYIKFSKAKPSIKLKKPEIGPVVYIAVFGTLVADLLYFYGLTQTSVINATIIGHLQPVFVIFLTWFFLKSEKINKNDYFGIFLKILAGLFTSAKTTKNLMEFNIGSFGDLMVLIAAVSWATTGLCMKKYISHLNSGVITFYRFGISSFAFFIYFLWNLKFFIPNIYHLLVGLIVGIGTILYYEALKRIKVAQVSAMELSSPVLAALLGFLILNETVSYLQMAGILLLILGVFFISRKETEIDRARPGAIRQPSREALEQEKN